MSAGDRVLVGFHLASVMFLLAPLAIAIMSTARHLRAEDIAAPFWRPGA